MAIDPLTICLNVEPCIEQYYGHSNFFREERAVIYSHWWASFVAMLFLHHPWIVFGGVALWELLEELSVALSVWLGWSWLRLKPEWDAADTMFDLLVSILGITAAMLLIWLLSLPRLVRLPHTELEAFQHEYHLADEGGIRARRVLRYSRSAYSWLAWKYFFQILAFSWLPHLAFWLGPSGFAARQADLDKRWVRPDWAIFTGSQIILVFLAWIWNWRNPIERDILWNRDKAAYNSLYVGWVSVLLLLMGPFIYTVIYPKTALMVGNMLVYIVLVPLTIRAMVADGRLPLFPWNRLRHKE